MVFEYIDNNHPNAVQIGTFESYNSTRGKVNIGDKIIIPYYKGGSRSSATGILRIRTVKSINQGFIITEEGGGCPDPHICWKLIDN